MTFFPLGGAGGRGQAADREASSCNAAQLPRFLVSSKAHDTRADYPTADPCVISLGKISQIYLIDFCKNYSTHSLRTILEMSSLDDIQDGWLSANLLFEIVVVAPRSEWDWKALRLVVSFIKLIKPPNIGLLVGGYRF